MPWWLYIAFKQLFPSGRPISFFAAVSVLGVALGVLGLFGTQSVMNGFHVKISQKLRDTSGDVIIKRGGHAFADYQNLLDKLTELEGVATAEAVAEGPAMVVYANTPFFPMLRSFDTVRGKTVLPIEREQYVSHGCIDDLDDDAVIIGGRLASRMGVSIGQKIEIYSPAMLDQIKKDEVPLPASLTVVGYLNTDYSPIDSNVMVVSLRRMQDLYGLGDAVHSIILRALDYTQDEALAKKLNNGLVGRLHASTWLDSNESFLNVIKMEKGMMSVIILLIIIVASFSICISLYTSVLRKTKEIGLMGAMGARPSQIILMYCAQGFFIGVLGSLSGLGLTWLILTFRDPIVEFIVGRENLQQFYFFTRLPVEYVFADAWRACLFATFLCTLAGFIPALWAARLKSSEAMRNE